MTEKYGMSTQLRLLKLPGGRLPCSPSLCMSEGAAASDTKYSETQEKLVLKYKGYLAGTIDTDGQVLPEWRIENRQTKLAAQGITVQTASRRASEAIQRTRNKYLESFVADGKSPQQVLISDVSEQSPYLCANTHAAAKNLTSTG